MEVQYFYENASFDTAVGMKPSLVVELSGTIGAQGLSFGAETGHDCHKEIYQVQRWN
jgi:voltage-dependent anion channel protein 2